MKKEQLNKNDVQFMKVNLIDEFLLLIYVDLCLARKYAALRRNRHCHAGKQQSLDDDEDDIGTYADLSFM